MERKWIKLKETGQLYLERVIVSFDVPVLFVCKDFENRKYLCLNIDDTTGKTVIAETYNEKLVAMLQDEVTMESVFRNALHDKIIIAEYDSVNEKIMTKIENAKDISSEMLPKKGAYLELADHNISGYISALQKSLIRIEVASFSQRKIVKVQQNRFAAYFTALTENVISQKCVKFKNTTMNYVYNIDNEKKMIA